MTRDTAVYTVQFENTQYTAYDYENVADNVVIHTDGETIQSEAKDNNELIVTITGSNYVIPLIEDELKQQLPHNTLIDCNIQ
jgi:hypothetical protein